MVAMSCGSFRHVIEHELGKLPCFVIYALLEWVLIGILLLDRFLSFFAQEFARLFELESPCTLCTRTDHVFNTIVYFNECVCERHKLQITTLAYCQTHKKVADLRSMCEGCLVGGDTQHELNKARLQKDEKKSKVCSCCEDSINKSSCHQKISITNGIAAAVTPAPSPIGAFGAGAGAWKNEKQTGGWDFSHQIKRSQSNFSLVTTPANEERILDDTIIEEQFKTPARRVVNGGSSDTTATGSPRFAPKKSMVELSCGDPNEPEDSIVNRLKIQMKMDRKSLVSLQTELDEERNAAAEAANNAMAMINQLQTDKAAVQMEALQYKRMMDEQSEYDQEALLSLKDLLDKREDEMKDLKVELEIYKDRYGALTDGIRHHRMDRSQSFASFNERCDKPIPEFAASDYEIDNHVQEGNSLSDDQIDSNALFDNEIENHDVEDVLSKQISDADQIIHGSTFDIPSPDEETSIDDETYS